MESFFEALSAFCMSGSPWVYAFIFLGKILEVSTSTLRIVLINRGVRLVGSLLAVFEIILWLVITSTVLEGFRSDIWKVVFYAAAFGCGNYLGSWLDERLAFGLSSIQAVVPGMQEADTVACALRDRGYAVTMLDVQGKEAGRHYMLMLMLKRKTLQEAVDIINQNCKSAVITVSDVKSQKGGYMRNTATRRKIIK
ncbi:MAG: DUF5698 domain-containing protein [Eubacteriales bacterium]|nr:DUF5698 domain-containing protein [Eubacteriales bacterium]